MYVHVIVQIKSCFAFSKPQLVNACFYIFLMFTNKRPRILMRCDHWSTLTWQFVEKWLTIYKKKHLLQCRVWKKKCVLRTNKVIYIKIHKTNSTSLKLNDRSRTGGTPRPLSLLGVEDGLFSLILPYNSRNLETKLHVETDTCLQSCIYIYVYNFHDNIKNELPTDIGLPIPLLDRR